MPVSPCREPARAVSRMTAVAELSARRLPRRSRQLLALAGLRCSLPRLKLLDALSVLGSGTAAELHAHLQGPAPSISFDCVSQSLRRLHQGGLLVRDAHKRYRLDPAFDGAAPAREAALADG